MWPGFLFQGSQHLHSRCETRVFILSHLWFLRCPGCAWTSLAGFWADVPGLIWHFQPRITDWEIHTYMPYTCSTPEVLLNISPQSLQKRRIKMSWDIRISTSRSLYPVGVSGLKRQAVVGEIGLNILLKDRWFFSPTHSYLCFSLSFFELSPNWGRDQGKVRTFLGEKTQGVSFHPLAGGLGVGWSSQKSAYSAVRFYSLGWEIPLKLHLLCDCLHVVKAPN